MYPKTTLPNGIRIVSHHMKERDSISIGIWIGAGGRHEEDAVKGVAHFLEHMLFKGSRKYSCNEIKELIEGVGGNLNGFTAEEMTCYYAKIPARYLDSTFDILADMVFSPTLALGDLEKERTVILEEIKMYRDLPQYFVLELLDEIMWPDHPLGKNLSGSPETVTAMAKDDLVTFHRQCYTGQNIVVAACGRLRHDDIVRLVRPKMQKIPRGGALSFRPANPPAARPRVKFYAKQTEQMHVALGMPGLADGHKDKYALTLLHIILGGNMSSRLFDELREKRGLAYSISSSLKYFRDTGQFLIRAGVDNSKLLDAVGVILKELKKIRLRGISLDEFHRAKDYYTGQVLLGLEDSLDHMIWTGESLVSRDRVRTIRDIIRDVRKVTREDIRRVAENILQDDRFHLAVIGPLSDEQEKELGRMAGR